MMFIVDPAALRLAQELSERPDGLELLALLAQGQALELLLERDPTAALGEVRRLTARLGALHMMAAADVLLSWPDRMRA